MECNHFACVTTDGLRDCGAAKSAQALVQESTAENAEAGGASSTRSRTGFDTLLVLDEHMGPADVLLRCRRCARHFLFEMIDLHKTARVYRVAAVDGEHATKMVRTLTRGSCDIRRAGAEVHNLQTNSTLLPMVVTMHNNRITHVNTLPDTRDIPKQSWRQLPCDGSWVALADD